MGMGMRTGSRILAILSDGRPRSCREIVEETGLSQASVLSALRRCWEKGLVLRSQRPLRRPYKRMRGRAGISVNLRSYYLYTIKRDIFIRPHMALNGKIPAEVANIDLDLEGNKWLSLIGKSVHN